MWLDLRVKTFDYWISTNLDFPTIDPDVYLYNTFHTSSSPAGWDDWSDTEIDALLDRAAPRSRSPCASRSSARSRSCSSKVAAFWSYAQPRQRLPAGSDGVRASPERLPVRLRRGLARPLALG